jgi:phosphoribosylformylglycinamidine synthase
MNFGNPEKPEIMGQFAGCIQGISMACEALDYPVVSGNVSLYNETHGQGILPTPTIGGIGLIKDINFIASISFKRENDVLFVIGDTKGHLGCSEYLLEIHGSEEGLPPEIDLSVEKRNGLFVQEMIKQGILDTVHDISAGGLLVTVAEMALASNIGAEIAFAYQPALLFGEDQSRYIIAVSTDKLNDFKQQAKNSDISIHNLGKTGGDTLILTGDFKVKISELKELHEKTLYEF